MTVAAPVPSTKRPRLPGKQKAAAAVAGIVGFILCSIGWTGIAIVLVILGLGASLASTLGSAASLDPQQAGNLANEFDPGQLLLPLAVVGLGGLVIWVLGIIISRGILKLSGHPKPMAVTFTGLLIAIVLSSILDAVLGGVFGAIIGNQFASGFAGLDVSAASSDPNALLASAGSAFNGILPTLAIWGALTLVVTVLAGWLSWLWMAIAFRAKSPEQLAAAQAGQYVPPVVQPMQPVQYAQPVAQPVQYAQPVAPEVVPVAPAPVPEAAPAPFIAEPVAQPVIAPPVAAPLVAPPQYDPTLAAPAAVPVAAPPVAEPVVQPVAQTAAEPVMQPAVPPMAEPVAQPLAQPIVQPVAPLVEPPQQS